MSTNKPQTTLAVVRKTRRRTRPNGDDYDTVATRARCNLSLLMRYMDAESLIDRGGQDVELDQDAAHAIELLLSTVRDDVARLRDELAHAYANAADALPGPIPPVSR